MPQLALQQVVPDLQIVLPHFSSTGYVLGIGGKTGGSIIISGTHFCFVQAPPGGTQIPQLGLQHVVPNLHVVLPHFSNGWYFVGGKTGGDTLNGGKTGGDTLIGGNTGGFGSIITTGSHIC
jgi:hypothetical protein